MVSAPSKLIVNFYQDYLCKYILQYKCIAYEIAQKIMLKTFYHYIK